MCVTKVSSTQKCRKATMQIVRVLISVELNSQLSLLTYHNAKCANHPSNPQKYTRALCLMMAIL